MYLTVKQQLKHLSKEEYLSLRELSHTAKNLYNQAVYNIRQYYFQENKYLNYQKNNSLLKSSDNYKKVLTYFKVNTFYSILKYIYKD